MEISTRPSCPLHNLPLLYLCCKSTCMNSMPVCQSCQPSHMQHSQKMITLQDFNQLLNSKISHQNSLETQLMKQNDLLSHELIKFRKLLENREKDLISLIMKKFQEQKSAIIRKVRENKEKEKQNIIRYFDKMCDKGLLYYRVMFSSQVGIQNFYCAYKQYCDASDISCHISQEIIPKPEEEDQQKLQERVRKSFAETLMESIMNYLKLKVSKRDMLRVSCIARDCTSVMKAPPPQPTDPQRNVIGLPPLSPPRRLKIGKTEVNITFKNSNK